MTAIHHAIWMEFQSTLSANPQAWDLENTHVQNEESFCRCMFHNYTPHYASLRLTNLGFRIVKTMYQCWLTPLPDDWNTLVNQGVTLLAFHKKLQVPYHWDRKNFYVFHSEIAFELQMVSNDFVAWMKAF